MNTAFITLDYINDIMHESGKIARSAAHAKERNVIAHANRALAFARQRGWLVIQVKVGFSEHYVELPKKSPMFGNAYQHKALLLGQKGTEFHPDLDVQPTDLIIVKPRVSAFYSSLLEAALRATNIERLIICGISSVWAVQATARDAHDRDYQVYIFEEGCAAVNQEEHQISMKMLSTIAQVVNFENIQQL